MRVKAIGVEVEMNEPDGPNVLHLCTQGCTLWCCESCPLHFRFDCSSHYQCLPERQLNLLMNTMESNSKQHPEITLEGGDDDYMKSHDRITDLSYIMNGSGSDVNYLRSFRTRGMFTDLVKVAYERYRVPMVELDIMCHPDDLANFIVLDERTRYENNLSLLTIKMNIVDNLLYMRDHIRQYKIHTTPHPVVCSLSDLDRIKRVYFDSHNIPTSNWYIHKYIPNEANPPEFRSVYDYTEQQLQEAAERLGAVYAA